jgi:aldehyde:ferredoxin oxidoreductase
MDKVMPGGYTGKVLRVNLTDRKISTEELDPLFCRRYIGGAGFITYYLWKELKRGVDALSPDNKIIFALGPISGLALAGAARHCIGAKSPSTGGIAKSEAGGHWMAELKRAGYDVIIVEGKSANPCYLWVKDDNVEIKDASHLWGKDTKETQTAIRQDLGDEKVELAMIGQAGENKVLYACIMCGLHDAAGRGGLGAVMGSKNLKAVAVRGTKPAPKVANEESFKEVRQWLVANPTPLHKFLSEFGTGGPDTMPFETMGNLPVRNFQAGLFPDLAKIHVGNMKDNMKYHMDGCYACFVRCKKGVGFDGPMSVDPAYGGPEYETIAAFGSDCGVNDVKAIVKANERCTAYSLDTISTGSTIAFAMECFEKGLLTTKDTDGLELKFGNVDAMLKCIELIAFRKGFGNLLAEGTARLSKKIGKGSEAFAMHVKGLEPGMHEPRLKPGLGYSFMLNPHGADHCWGPHDVALQNPQTLAGFNMFGVFGPLTVEDTGPKKVGFVKLTHLNAILGDAMVTCNFLPYGWDVRVKVMNAVTGWNTTVPELMRAAERIITLARVFNINQGLSAADDVLPARFFQPKTDGVLSKTALDRKKIDEGRKFYYSLMGWDEQGVPSPAKLQELEIE